MAVTQDSFTGNGTKTDYDFTFPYLKQNEIKASLDGTATANFRFLTATRIQFVNNTTANTPTAPASGVKIKIFRETETDSLAATFYAGSSIKSEDLNDNFTQNLYAVQEVTERYLSNLGGTMVGDLNLGEDVVLKFEGATDNAHETTLTVTDPTADRTITLPNVTGTVITTGDTGTVATGMIAADAVNGTKIADDSINSEHYVDGSIDTAHIADSQITTAKILDANVTTAKILDANVTTAKIADSNVTTAKIAADAVNGTKIADDSIDSEHYVDGSIDTAHIADSQITSAKIADATIVAADLASNAVTTAKITDANVTTAKIADSNVTTAKIADNAITTAKVTDANITTAKLAANSVTTAKITDANVTTAKIADSNVTTAKIADNNVTTAKIPDNAITTAKIADAELTTLAGMQSGTASRLADSTALTSTTAELNILDNKSFRASGDGTLTTTSDTEIPSSKVVAAHVAAQLGTVGGFSTIATEIAFPATASQPAAGVIISISDAAGVVVNGSGVSTTGRTTDGTPATVTINSFPSSLNGETLAAGVGLLVTSTGSGNTYTYHKLLAAETDVKQLSDDINDFNARYRVASSAPGSNNDAGDMYFDTAANKMKVYNGTTSAWDDVASVGNFYINTISSSSNTGGGSATFNGSAYRFTLSNAPTMAQQLIVSINGVIQKPNAGSSQPSEGFAISGNDIIFSAAPTSGSDYFIVTQGSSVSIGTPSDNTVSTAKIQNLAVTNAKIANDTIAEGKLDVHNAPATGKYLKYTSNGMEWSDGASEGTDVKSTGESGTAKFLRVDGDGTCSWQVPPDTNTQVGGATGVDFHDSTKIRIGAGNDLELHHDGNSYINNTTANQLAVQSDDLKLRSYTDLENYLVATHNGSVDIYHNGVKKLETTSTGINVTGAINVNGAALSAAPEVTLTASEAITAEDAIMVKTNGQAEKITGVNSGVHAENSFSGWSSSNQAVFNICYDPSQNKYLWVGSTGPSNTSTRTLSMRVGTPSSNGETLTWGTLTEMTALGYPESHAEYVKHAVNLVYDDTEDKIFFCYRDKENSGKMRIGWVTISGTTPSIYGQQLLHSWSNINSPSCWYNATNGQVNVAYSWSNNSGRIYTNRVYKSGTTPEFSGSTHVTGNNNYAGQCVDGAFGNGVNAIVWKRTSGSNYPVVALSSPGSGSSGAPGMDAWATDLDTVNAGQYGGVSICYHATANKFVAMWHGDGSSTANNEVRARVITCSSSGVTLSGSVQDVATVTNSGFDTLMNVEYDSNAEKVIFTYRKSNRTKLKTASISGNALVFDDEYDINAGTANMIHSTIDTTKNKTLVMTDLGGSKVFTPPQTNLDANRFVGFAKASVSSGAEVTVKVASNTSTRSETLTPGTTYYIQDTGGVGTTIPNSGTIKAGLAIASNKLLIKD